MMKQPSRSCQINQGMSKILNKQIFDGNVILRKKSFRMNMHKKTVTILIITFSSLDWAFQSELTLNQQNYMLLISFSTIFIA